MVTQHDINQTHKPKSVIHTKFKWKTTQSIDGMNQSNGNVSLVTVVSSNLTLPNQQFRTTENLSIYPWKIQEFQIENWYDTYKSLNGWWHHHANLIAIWWHIMMQSTIHCLHHVLMQNLHPFNHWFLAHFVSNLDWASLVHDQRNPVHKFWLDDETEFGSPCLKSMQYSKWSWSTFLSFEYELNLSNFRSNKVIQIWEAMKLIKFGEQWN